MTTDQKVSLVGCPGESVEVENRNLNGYVTSQGNHKGSL